MAVFTRLWQMGLGARVLLTFFVMSVCFVPSSTAKGFASTGQLIKAGEVGITRGEFISYYGSLPGGGALVSTIDLQRVQVFTSMESRKFGLSMSGSFRLASDLRLRDSDRLINITIEPNKAGRVWSLETAGRLVGLMLPSDAISSGKAMTNSIGEPVAMFYSATIAEMFPSEATCTGDAPGTIWVTVTPTGGDTIGLIDISISNPEENDCI